MKIVSWNVNGLRAITKKGFRENVASLDADILLIQETKMQESQLEDEHFLKEMGYTLHMHSALRKGYSGVAAYIRIPVDSVRLGIGIPDYDAEGRVIRIDKGAVTLFNIYFPNGGSSEERLAYKMRFYEDLLIEFRSLRDSGRKVIITGDFNVAHNEIDLKNPKSNETTSGFLPIEREWFTRLLASGFMDVFREMNPETEIYTWWDQRFKARDRNVGWRIDYFVVSDNADTLVMETGIHNEYYGSDHCPISLVIAEGENDGL